MGRATVADYGGNHYGGRPRFAKVTKTTAVSLRCPDCNTMRWANRLELARAARPRCLECGGLLRETEAARKRARGPRPAPAPPRATDRCRACGAGFFGAPMLAAHLRREAAGCLAEYRAEGYPLPPDAP
jgi:hypothetical protein